MNPLFQALTGGAGLPGQNPMPAAGTSAGAFQGVLGRAQQLAAMFQNPQQIVQRYFPSACGDENTNLLDEIEWGTLENGILERKVYQQEAEPAPEPDQNE